MTLDDTAVQRLVQCNQKLATLISVFKTFVTGAWPITDQGAAELKVKLLVTSILSQHLGVVLWFVDVGLLPESDGKFVA